MRRRRVFTAIGGLWSLSISSGCAELLQTETADRTSHPGGTLVIENKNTNAHDVSVFVVEEEWSATFDGTVPATETVVEPEFVTASEGAVVTLAARIGEAGEPTTFEFLPAGGTDDTPPEVAVLTVVNVVEASASWTAHHGT